MMKMSSHELETQNQRMSMLSEKLRRSKIKSRGAPPSKGDDDRKTASSTIPKVVDLSPPATDMGNESQDFPSSSSTATCETCEESAITCSKNSPNKDATSSPLPRQSFKNSFFLAQTPRRDNISMKHELSDDFSNEAACITPSTPKSDEFNDYDVTASPEIDNGNKADDDDDESLLDSVLNEEMEHLISIDSIHEDEDVHLKMDQGLITSVTTKEEDDYLSLLSESSKEYNINNTDSAENQYQIDMEKCKMSIDNRMAMIREKVKRLKNQSTSMNQESIEPTTIRNGVSETDGEMTKRLDEVLKKVTEVQNENIILKKMNKRLIAILEAHGISVFDQPLFMKDKDMDLSTHRSRAKEEIKMVKEGMLDTEGSRKKEDDTVFQNRTRDEEYKRLFEELVNLQDERHESSPSDFTISTSIDTKPNLNILDPSDSSLRKM
jgi:hypothetical protein